jgi:hypothetical protein
VRGWVWAEEGQGEQAEVPGVPQEAGNEGVAKPERRHAMNDDEQDANKAARAVVALAVCFGVGALAWWVVGRVLLWVGGHL